MTNNLIWGYYIIVNLIAFILYYVDKQRAIKEAWRIPEKTLLGIAFIGGGLGAHMGMKVWHHKTQKTLFRILVPITIFLHVGLILTYAYGFLNLN